MAQAALSRVLTEVQTLEPTELLQVQRVVGERLAAVGETRALERVYAALLASGLVTTIKLPIGQDVERPLVPIEGMPLSETIIAERR